MLAVLNIEVNNWPEYSMTALLSPAVPAIVLRDMSAGVFL
jgi:hypothetical protein